MKATTHQGFSTIRYSIERSVPGQAPSSFQILGAVNNFDPVHFAAPLDRMSTRAVSHDRATIHGGRAFTSIGNVRCPDLSEFCSTAPPITEIRSPLLMLLTVIIAFFLPGGLTTIHAQFGGGAGTAVDPYLVATAEQLNSVREHRDSHFRQTADIDLGVAPWNEADGWLPIGMIGPREAQPFGGTFDGNGRVIRNLTIRRPGEERIGLFAEVGTGGELRTVGLAGGSVSGWRYVGAVVGVNRGVLRNCHATTEIQGNEINSGWGYIGGLVGYNEGSLEECHATGNVSGRQLVGGLVGDNYGLLRDCYATGHVSTSSDGAHLGGLAGGNYGPLIGCHASGNVSGARANAGGLVGTNGGTVTMCHATGRVSGGTTLGGLIGLNLYDWKTLSLVSACYATGSVIGRDAVGGLVGINNGGPINLSYATGAVECDMTQAGGLVGINYGTIENSYATGSVVGQEAVGGLVGYHFEGSAGNGWVINCYSSGEVNGVSDVGGLIGEHWEDTVIASFWDTSTSGHTESAWGIGVPTARMTEQVTFVAEGWDFDDVWAILEGLSYPFLRSTPLTRTAAILSPTRSGTLLAGDMLRLTGIGGKGLWDFGDGRAYSGQNPGVVRFTDAGDLTVTYSAIVDDRRDPFPDTRLIAVVEESGPLPDLRVASVTVPDSLRVGEPALISYSVRNLGDGPAGATWQDAIYLSRDRYLDIRDTRLASVMVVEDLAADAGYENTLQVSLPAVVEGAYHLILVVDDEWQVLDRRRLNNEHAVATDVLIPRLELGVGRTVHHEHGTLDHHYLVQIPFGGQGVHLRFDAVQPGFSVFLRHGTPPSSGVYDHRVTDGNLFIPSATGGDWYVLVSGQDVPDPGEYTIALETVALRLVATSPAVHDARMPLGLTLTGIGFLPATSVELLNNSGTAYAANVVETDSLSRLTATFGAHTLTPGVYTVRVTRDGESDELENGIEILAAGSPRLETQLIVPGSVGLNVPATLYVEYANTGEVTMPAPLLVLGPRDPLGPNRPLLSLDPARVASGTWAGGMPAGFSHSIQFLASGASPGLLQAGESGRVPVYYVGLRELNESDSRVHFSLGVLTAEDDTPVDWDDIKHDLRPFYVREDAWNVVWANFVGSAGSTWGDYVAMLSRIAVYLDRQGQSIRDINRFLAFAFREADGLSPLPVLSGGTDASVQAPGLPIVFQRSHAQPISRRFELGPLGRGWTHNWQHQLEVREDGTVLITDWTGNPRIFQPDNRPNRHYLAAPGDQGDLRAMVGGGFRLVEANGLVRLFRADGRLDYIQDTNGNRITCNHSGDQLTGLTHSSGQSLAIVYNQDGRVISVTDDHGREARYAYDGEHLVGVSAHDGRTTSYAYHATPGSAAQHALTDIALPNGTQRTFTYDERGRLATTVRNNDVELIKFDHGPVGRVTATDAVDQASRFYFDYAGRMVKFENPLAEIIRFDFDDVGRLAAMTDPAGMISTFGYDRRGNQIRADDALRQTTRFTYSPVLNRLASTVDAKGNLTLYHNDTRGNLEAIRYADGSRETWSYDERGNPVAWTNRRGTPIQFEHNAAGRVTRKTFADESEMHYLHDERGNLIETNDPHGKTTFHYDARDYLVRIGYPGNRWIEFTYDSAGRRVSSLDQAGHRLDYHYDDLGRLERLTDETADELVVYEYDAVGRLARKTVGNGVRTDYAYDAAGQLVSLINRAPDSSVISQFDYRYDRRGRRISMETHYGDWSYEYDDTGQLTRAMLVSTAAEIPNHDLSYTYDAVGNRIRTVINGETTEYTVNSLNQYVQAGDRTYTYDLDGNLIEESGPHGTTLYSYNDENRLIAITQDADTREYTYDAFGTRVAATINGAVTHYIMDPGGLGDLVGEYDTAGNLVARHDHGIGLLNRTDSTGTTRYYSFDSLGNVSEVTSPDGLIENAYVYDPFGNLLLQTVSVPNPFEYVGEWGVMAAGMAKSYMRARFYDLDVGRFQTPDPMGILSGEINSYRYSGNQPTAFVDPEGEALIELAILLGGAVLKGKAAAMLVVKATGAAAKHKVAWGAAVGTKHILTHAEKIGEVGRAFLYSFMEEMTDSPGAATLVAPAIEVGKQWPKTFMAFLSDELEGSIIKESVRRLAGVVRAYQWMGSPEPDVPAASVAAAVSGIALARDPNEKTGPSGFGAGNYVPAGQSLPYRVDFENLESATAPAQVVTVSDPLSGHLDWSTFQLMEIGFGDELVLVPEGRRQYFEIVVPYELEGVEFEVHIQAGIHAATGEAFAYFYTLDPETELPPSVDVGFLPPEDGTGRGQGHISYVIRPKSDLPSGTAIRNVATIQFDFGLKIDTNQVDPLDPSQGTDPGLEALVTIDSEPPSSRVHALPDTSPPRFTVSWSGTDDASGIRSFDIYVSENGGPFQLWTSTDQTESVSEGEIGHSYAFYSVAVDHVGNRESKEPLAEAVTSAQQMFSPGGIPIDWLLGHDLPTDGSVDHIDLDGDGRTVFQEWIAGTDPTDPKSTFRLHPPTSSHSGLTISWNVVAGRRYSLHRSERLDDPNWTVVHGPVDAFADGVLSHTDPIQAQPAFYRVQVELFD